MKNNPLNQGVLTENVLGVGTVTRKTVHARARESSESGNLVGWPSMFFAGVHTP
jgi:hypothetical protein